MLTLATLLLASSTSLADAPDRCDYELGKYLAMSPMEFDQGEGGWRHLANITGCEREAAELIQRYVQHNENMRLVLLWHRGQLLAFTGAYKEAIAEMAASKKSAAADFDGWNFYVDGTIAFLRNDRKAFHRAVSKLRSLERPAGYPEGDLEWPPNLSVLRQLEKCFGSPYKQAYSNDC